MGRGFQFDCIFTVIHPNSITVSKSDNLNLLEKSFAAKDWEYLINNATFQRLLSEQNGTLEEFESLVSKGTLLLRQRDELKG
jgi:hypothetical protein